MTNLRRYFYAIILQCVFVSTFIVIDITIFCQNLTFLHDKKTLCGDVFKRYTPQHWCALKEVVLLHTECRATVLASASTVETKPNRILQYCHSNLSAPIEPVE